MLQGNGPILCRFCADSVGPKLVPNCTIFDVIDMLNITLHCCKHIDVIQKKRYSILIENVYYICTFTMYCMKMINTVKPPLRIPTIISLFKNATNIVFNGVTISVIMLTYHENYEKGVFNR